MTITETANYLLSNNNFLILTHRSPDGDTLGSAGGLCRALRSVGKTAYVAENEDLGQRLAFLVEGLFPPQTFVPQTTTVVDLASLDLLPQGFKDYKIDLDIDHHPAEKPVPNITDTSCAATCELIFLILREMGVALTAEIALPLYVGLCTDTGCLRYSNVTPRTLRVAADLLETGFSPSASELNHMLFEQKSIARLKLEADLIANTRFYAGGKVAIGSLPLIEDDLADGVSAIIRNIEGVECGILLREQDIALTRVSVRTAKTYSANEICKSLGGGGHARAAGALVAQNISGTRREILKILGTEE